MSDLPQAPAIPAPSACREALEKLDLLLDFSDTENLTKWEVEDPSLIKEAFEFAHAALSAAQSSNESVLTKMARESDAEFARLTGIIFDQTKDLRRLVDVVWQHATESTAVPSTKTADMLIERARLQRSSEATSQAIKEAYERVEAGIDVLRDRSIPVPMELHKAAHALSYAVRDLGARPPEPNLRKALEGTANWLEGCLQCKTWNWDGLQRDAAEQALKEAREALAVSAPGFGAGVGKP